MRLTPHRLPFSFTAMARFCAPHGAVSTGAAPQIANRASIARHLWSSM